MTNRRCFMFCALLAWSSLSCAEPLTIELTCVDSEATGYGTFQSHNQKVVSNQRGYFMTHIRTRNEAYTAQQWRLSWSKDQGKTFTTLFEATHATNPPVLETDSRDNLYLIRPDFEDGNAYLYRFLASQDYQEPQITTIAQGAAGKFSMALDEARQRIYYFAHNNTFHTISLDGAVESSIRLLRPGRKAILQYPLLYLDSTGTLHASWTTQRHGVYLYWDIHYLRSSDGGKTWQAMTGASVNLPVVADEGGASTRISLDDEFESHTWLSSFLIRDNKAHFYYLAQTKPPRQHYVRSEWSTGRRELDMHPVRGESLALSSLDGFFAAAATKDASTIFLVSRDAERQRLACLASSDNGTTWRDHSVSQLVANPYSIGGCRKITRDGHVIGSFTDQIGSNAKPSDRSKVYFFRLRAE